MNPRIPKWSGAASASRWSAAQVDGSEPRATVNDGCSSPPGPARRKTAGHHRSQAASRFRVPSRQASREGKIHAGAGNRHREHSRPPTWPGLARSTPTSWGSRPRRRSKPSIPAVPHGGGFRLSASTGRIAGQAGHTIAQWHIADVDGAVADLKDKGVSFEHYDMPGVKLNNDVATLPGMGKAAWFKDSENNILCIDDGFPGEPAS